MSIKPGETAYYLDDHSDEFLPEALEGTNLEDWAKWLSGPFGPEDIRDGQEFAASKLTFLDDVTVTRVPVPEDPDDDFEELEYSPPLPPNIDFLALRIGPGLGWDADSILDPDDPRDGLIGFSDLLEVGDEGLLAVATSTDIRLRYRADPPRLELIGSVQ